MLSRALPESVRPEAVRQVRWVRDRGSPEQKRPIPNMARLALTHIMVSSYLDDTFRAIGPR
jgi:hypothetical protein